MFKCDFFVVKRGMKRGKIANFLKVHFSGVYNTRRSISCDYSRNKINPTIYVLDLVKISGGCVTRAAFKRWQVAESVRTGKK